ncbi:error-prone DNA polymerase [Psychromicrobium lacuslunae]|uniref:Error-prone DNA polymerase n=1 Tax=Psychromicrobium lacuslunae TaxID=1618207 RepID=A0A0D4C1N4_9MICC|nr:error-prone DNA polymerase [Psychromicrobium lacuslunae]AJT42315.1 DNA polymerase III subunit alpha [Psychromicrobium lacuslunae]
MGWHNPPMPWKEFERKLSGRPALNHPEKNEAGKASQSLNAAYPEVDGGDAPAWSYHRPPYIPAEIGPPAGPVLPYAELHAHSNFSFLDGASEPAELVEEAVRLGLHALAITDHDGLYGAAIMAEAAASYPQLKTIYGAELSLGLSKPQNGEADPEGNHLLILARGIEGYHRLSSAITQGQLAHGAQKGRPRYQLSELANWADGHWLILTGCRKGAVRRALAAGLTEQDGGAAAEREVSNLVALFGAENVVVELYDHGNPQDSATNDLLAGIAARLGLPVVATNNVHYARPEQHRTAAALAAVRARRSLDELDGWLPSGPGAFMRSGAEMENRFGRFRNQDGSSAVGYSVQLAEQLAFPLNKAKPRLPKLALPEGETQMSHLRNEVWRGAAEKYPDLSEEKRQRIENELAVIEAKDFPGYFLIVHEIVQYAKKQGILCQGRGSAANSAVCYLLGITAVDSIKYDLPFERFLSSIRDEEPDIDVDFDARRREEVIQHVYETYGRLNAAQVANVISYRPKFAVRDMAKALGYSSGQQDAWSKQLENPYGGSVRAAYGVRSKALQGLPKTHTTEPENDIPEEVQRLAADISKFPRHLGIHSGGMVLTERPVSEICPIEHARMENRTVLQWDKDACAYMGLVKFDLLGLGMLAALQHCFDLVRDNYGEQWTLDTIPKEEQAVYDQLCLADSIGVFQVESRAQISILPRLKPRKFYDLVVEVALVRPGPIQGGAVHPYMRQRAARVLDPEAEISYDHPLLEPVLKRTLGVPIFQEQLMQMAIAVGNCTPEDADLLRRAMGSKRGEERIESLKAKLFNGMAENGITGEAAEGIYQQIAAFANFGFAESHSISFALLVYVSAWLRLHYPAAFLASLLRSQPMGFYSARTLVEDARRHGVEVRGPDLLRSGVEAGLEFLTEPADEPEITTSGRSSNHSPDIGHPASPATEATTQSNDHNCHNSHLVSGLASCLEHEQPAIRNFDKDADHHLADHRRDKAHVVRLGLSSIKAVSSTLAERIVAERAKAPFSDLADLSRRVEPSTAQLEALAAAGALESLINSRREALWQAGPASQERADQLPGIALQYEAPMLPVFTELDQLVSDIWTTGISPKDHPLRHLRKELQKQGIARALDLKTLEPGRRIRVAGVVTHRQRPATANSTTFINVEDETGLINVVCSEGAWNRHRRVVRESAGLIVRGILERSAEGVTNLLADHFEELTLPVQMHSRDFR